jgi:hypothetical protein
MLVSAHYALTAVGELVDSDRKEIVRGDSTAAEMYSSALKLIGARPTTARTAKTSG